MCECSAAEGTTKRDEGDREIEKEKVMQTGGLIESETISGRVSDRLRVIRECV